jgi:hypothetical protein
MSSEEGVDLVYQFLENHAFSAWSLLQIRFYFIFIYFLACELGAEEDMMWCR